MCKYVCLSKFCNTSPYIKHLDLVFTAFLVLFRIRGAHLCSLYKEYVVKNMKYSQQENVLCTSLIYFHLTGSRM